MARLACLALVALSWLAPASVAQSDPRIDHETGAEQAHYPPARPFDHLHMRLVIDIPSMLRPALTATETLTVTPIGRERTEIVLNAVGMEVSAVRVGGKAAAHAREKGKLTVALPRPLPLGSKTDIEIDYALDLSKGIHGEGLTYLEPEEDSESPTDASPLIYSQGQPEFNRRWFPCHDFPNERLTTELIVTVENGYTVVSNGRLLGSRAAPASGEHRRTTWHWLQDKPHPNYLVTLVIGRFSIVGLPAENGEATPRTADGREVPCYLYTPIGSEKAALDRFGRTPAILAFFAERLGEPYPWDKYAQVLVRGFNGGMENTSATTMMAELASMPRAFTQAIIVHEAAHQWFGDLITCKSWEHAWLNEGWASYGEALWVEHAARPDRRQAAYQRAIARLAGDQRRNSTTAPDTPPLASGRYDFPLQNFMKPNDIYGKGSLVLHMLRMRMGDEAFWNGVRLYVQRHRFREVETDDFRRCMEEVSGLGLERFFQQWCFQPGMPRVEGALEWTENGAGGELAITLEQKQHIDADNPAFALSFPVHISYEDGSSEERRLECDARAASARWTLKARPKGVEIDPAYHNGVRVRVTKPLAMWLDQAASTSVFAQLQAVEHLSALDGPAGAAALVRMLIDASRDGLARQMAADDLLERTRPALAAARDLALSIAGAPVSPQRMGDAR